MCKSQIQQLGRSKIVDNRSKEEVCATWSVRELIGEEEVLKYYNAGIKIAAIKETKKKLQGTNDTRNLSIIYSRVKQNMRKIWSDAIDAKNTT
jgi:hypothetical protein